MRVPPRLALPALAAALQLAVPAGAMLHAALLVPVCGEAGRAVPVGGGPLPGRDGPCCKICHIAMRKRSGAGTCCDDGTAPDPDPDRDDAA